MVYIFRFRPTMPGCKEGHRFVKKITKKDKKGDELFDRGEYGSAIDSWWEAMNADISLLAYVRPTLLKVVKAHVALRQYDKAIEEATKHVNNEESVEGLLALGGAQVAGERFDDAIRTYNRAHEIAVSCGRDGGGGGGWMDGWMDDTIALSSSSRASISISSSNSDPLPSSRSFRDSKCEIDPPHLIVVCLFS
jgi:hypothetical protein